MDIYIKPVKKVSLIGRKAVYVKDVCELLSSDASAQKAKSAIITVIEENKKTNTLVSSMDIINAILNVFPNATVNNLGEMDTLVEYFPTSKGYSKLINTLKIIFVSVVLFFGAATAIMSFHADGEIPEIMKSYYKIFYNEEKDNPLILEIPYSLGLAAGIIIFFNHFGKFNVTSDPTPLEVQLTTYEKETIDSLIDTLDKTQEKG